MIHTLSRRQILLAATAIAAPSLALAQSDVKVDLSDLMTPPSEGDMTMGPADAKVTIIEYGSASCPHCAEFALDALPKLKSDYIDTGKVRFIFREFPHNDQALAGFMVMRCSPKEQYFPLLDVMFKTQEKWVPDAYNGLKNIATQAGMSVADYDKCIKNEDIAKKIFEVRDKAAKNYGINAIPTLFINGKQLDGDHKYETLKAAIDPLLK